MSSPHESSRRSNGRLASDLALFLDLTRAQHAPLVERLETIFSRALGKPSCCPLHRCVRKNIEMYGVSESANCVRTFMKRPVKLLAQFERSTSLSDTLPVSARRRPGSDTDERERVKREMGRKLHFLDWASLHYISGLRGTGLKSLMRSVAAAEQAAFRRLPTPRLTRALIAAVQRQQPPRAGN